MKNWCRRFINPETRCVFWIAMCFTLNSVAYLSWVYRLVAQNSTTAVEWSSLVVGYLCQAAGLAAISHALHARPGFQPRKWFLVTLFLFAILSSSALMGDNFAGTVISGLLMNITCGVNTGIYLYGMADAGDGAHHSILFGCGCAAGTFMTALLAFPAGGALLKGSGSLAVCLLLCLGLAVAARHSRCFDTLPVKDADAAGTSASSLLPEVPENTLVLAFAAILAVSMVKNMGFTFPSADIAEGLRPEFSRIPYGIGLMAAGLINDRDRAKGVLCTITALAIPFVMLNVQSEPVLRTLLWGLDYFFFSFFTVVRVILFIDLARKTQRAELIPVGLLAGRLGDAGGTAIGLVLADRRLVLIVTTFAGFAIGVFLLFRLDQRLYGQLPAAQTSEHEIYEAFCLRYDLSAREQDVLRMLLDNSANAEIADALFISVNTVKTHVRNVLQKTGCKNRVELQQKYKQEQAIRSIRGTRRFSDWF